MIELFCVFAHAQVAVARLEVSSDQVLLSGADADWRARIYADLADNGVETRGAEDAMFGRDEAATAPYVLGGRVVSISSLTTDPPQVEVAVEWKVLERSSDAVIYSVVSTGYAARSAMLSDLARAAVDDAVARLAARERFRAAVTDAREPGDPVEDTPDGSRLRTTLPSVRKKPKGRENAARILRISGAAGLGAGTLIIVPTVAVAEGSTWASDVAWAGLVTANTAGWALAITGGAALATGVFLAEDGPMLVPTGPGLALVGRF